MSITTFLLIVAVMNFALAFFVFKSAPRQKLNQFFSLSTLLIGSWVLLNFYFQTSNSILILKMIYALAPFILITIPIWISYQRKPVLPKWLGNFLLFFFVLCVVNALVTLFTSEMVVGVVNYEQYTTGRLFDYYTAFLILLTVAFIVYIVEEFINSDPKNRKQLTLIMLGMVAVAVVTGIVGILLPAFGVTKYNVLDSPSSIVFVILSAYSIGKQQLLDIKGAVNEILIYFLVVLMFFVLFFSQKGIDYLAAFAVFALTVYTAVLLVRGLTREQQSRIRLEEQARELAKDKEQLVELDRMKDEFLQMATHELNTPISIIKGRLDMAIDENLCKLNDEQKKFLQPVLDDTARLAQLSRDILDTARIDQRRLKLNVSEVDVAGLTERIVSSLQPKARDKKIKLLFEKNSPEIPAISADESKISEVITNLINNAIKFTDKGHVKASIEMSSENIVVKVEDTGIGIEEKDQKHLFQKFYQAGRFDPNHPREQQGTGLGLYISKNIINLHGGEISLLSKIGEGSTFSFTLPIEDSPVEKLASLTSSGQVVA